MTIIAGFKSYQGIVICADTLETADGSAAKRHSPKLRFEPADENTEGFAAAFCGAGNGALIDKLVENAWEAAQLVTNLDEACTEIENSIKATYTEFGQIFQTGLCPSAQLIYGVKMHDSSRLFTASGPIVNEKSGYDSSGIGYYLADFIAGRMYETHLTLRQCVILAAYILYQCKENVEGCGGDSHIAILRNEGVSGMVSWHRVEKLTELLRLSDKQISQLLFGVADLTLDKEAFKEKVISEADLLETLRDNTRTAIDDHARFWQSFRRGLLEGSSVNVGDEDEFGFEIPPVADEGSEPKN